MTKAVKVYVVDDKGNGIAGQVVKTYGGDSIKTDRDGCATLIVDGGSTTIYVNGHTAFNGSASNLDKSEIFTKSGGRT